jgi:uncharacterized protein
MKNLFKTKDNTYFFSEKKKEFLFVPDEFLNALKKTTDEKEISEIDKKYYKRKYLFLKKHGYFEKVDRAKVLGGRLNESNIEQFIASTRQIIFEVTENCNLECKYCYYGDMYSNRKTSTNKLEFESAKRLIDYLIDLKRSNKNTIHNGQITIS